MSFFEEQLLLHASPVISGIKVSNMFSVPVKCAPEISGDFRIYSNILMNKGIKMKFFYCKEGKVNIFAYGLNELFEALNDDDIIEYLKRKGYPSPEKDNISPMIDTLKKRILETNEYPHEIGFFLGYPKDDVFEFIDKKGRNYKSCGFWKVYTDEKRANDIFCSYKMIRDKFLNMAKSGVPVINIVLAA